MFVYNETTSMNLAWTSTLLVISRNIENKRKTGHTRQRDVKVHWRTLIISPLFTENKYWIVGFESLDDHGCWIELEIVVKTALHPFFCLLRVVAISYFVTHDYFQNHAIVRTLDLKFSKRYIKPRWLLFPFCTNL